MASALIIKFPLEKGAWYHDFMPLENGITNQSLRQCMRNESNLRLSRLPHLAAWLPRSIATLLP